MGLASDLGDFSVGRDAAGVLVPESGDAVAGLATKSGDTVAGLA